MFWVGVMGIWVLTAAFTKWNGRVMTVAGREGFVKSRGEVWGDLAPMASVVPLPTGLGLAPTPQGVLEEVRVLGPTFLPHRCLFSFSWVRGTRSGAPSHSSLLPPTWGGA